MYGLKPVPFEIILFGILMYGLKPVPFKEIN
jgi:hypothetical protein